MFICFVNIYQITKIRGTTQQIDRKHLTLRTRLKRLAHKTIWFSNSICSHDTVIGLFVNSYGFGNPV